MRSLRVDIIIGSGLPFLSGACFSTFLASSGTSDQLALHSAWSSSARYRFPFSGFGALPETTVIASACWSF